MFNFATENKNQRIIMSNTIGFSNFRRFINFPEIELGDITILVGGNNAGKSTLVKAMLLMRDFLKSRIESVVNTDNIFKTMDPQFKFDTEHVNVGEFYRAFCRQSPRKENTISFTMGIDHFYFIVNITGERKPGVIPQVSLIAVKDNDRNASFTFDFAKNQMTARFGYNSNQDSYNKSEIVSITQKIEHLKEELANRSNLDRIAQIQMEINDYEHQAQAIYSKLATMHREEANAEEEHLAVISRIHNDLNKLMTKHKDIARKIKQLEEQLIMSRNLDEISEIKQMLSDLRKEKDYISKEIGHLQEMESSKRNLDYLSDFNERKEELIKENHRISQVLNQLKEQLAQSRNLDEISKIKMEIEQLEKKAYILSLHDVISEAEEESVTIEMSHFLGNNIGRLIIPELINGFVYYTEIGTLGDKRSKAYKEQEGKKNFLRGKETIIKSISQEIERVVDSQTIEYIYAHSVDQTSFYSNASSSNDYATRTIHEFYKSRISNEDEEFAIIEQWLKNFKIGESLRVIPFLGDSYRVIIFDKENPAISSVTRKGYPGGIDLADKCMGSIQLVILLLRIATLLRKYKGQQLTILLEEPEQNLHPALQSKLADLIYNVNNKFGVRFVVETHSEYIVRKSQVIVAEANKSDNIVKNPFKVYYLPNAAKPYEMIYRTDGKFSNEFETGFFDEANNLLFDIL